jgi:hypothetical protein
LIFIFAILFVIYFSSNETNEMKNINKNFPRNFWGKTFNKISKEDVLLYGNPVFTKSIRKLEKITFQATLYDKGILVINNDKKINIDKNLFETMMKLKDEILKENPVCCPDHNIDDLGLHFLHLHDANVTFQTMGSCHIPTTISSNKLESILNDL